MKLSCALLTALTLILAPASATADEQIPPPRYAIAIHGGAGSAPSAFSAEQNIARHDGLKKALQAGQKILDGGGTSLDAVEAVIRILEDDPLFNAGRGAVLNAEGKAELDASIMDGRNKACGADRPADRIGTVGCVALDSHGNLAAGTSTGGLMMKRFGRVGDSPLVGAGTYADNATCAVSCTGVGEEFIRNAIAYDVSAQMKYAKADLDSAVSKNLEQTLKPGYGGIIALDREGNIAMEYNTKGMACAAADASGKFEVRWPRGNAR